MITHAIAYRNGELVRIVNLVVYRKKNNERSNALRLLILEIERAAQANPENKYWIDLKQKNEN